MKRHWLILILMSACSGPEVSDNHSIMLEFGPRFDRVAGGLRVSNLQATKEATADFNAYLASEGYQNYVLQQEPNSQTRWLMLADDLHALEIEAAAGHLEAVRGFFTKTRDACLSCHYITRTGENRTYLDREIADITKKDTPPAVEGQ